MAASGYFNSTGYEGRFLELSWKVVGQSIANNTTTISWTLKGAGTGKVSWYNAGKFKVTLDGQTVYSFSDRIKLYDGTVVAGGTYTLKHNSDGDRSFTASVEAAIYSYEVNCSGSGSFTLDTIARASQPSCITCPEHTQNVGSFGDTISIHMNRKSSAFTHTVRYQFGSRSGTIATGVGTGVQWTIPMSLMELMPSTVSGSGTIYVDTYNGSVKVGTKSCGFTATVPSGVKPGCGLSLEDVTGTDKIYGSPVKGLSQIKVTVNATTAYGSPIDSCLITANGVRYNQNVATTGLLLTSGTSRVTAVVKDKRGRSWTASYDMSVQDYKQPSVSALSVLRCNEDGTENSRGEYVKVTFSADVSSMGGKNNALYKLRYKKASATSYTEVSLSDISNTYSVSNYEYIFSADGSDPYDIQVTATDRHSTAARSTSASTAFTLLHLNGYGNGLSIGGVSEDENTVKNYLEFNQIGNSFAFQAGAFNGDKGYTLLAVITIKQLNVNAPVCFKINRRGAACPMTVYARFASSSSTTDPDLDSFTYEGDNYGAFLVKEASSTWKLYVDNTSGWTSPCVQDWFTTDNQMARISVDFQNDQISSLPEPYYRATPLISRSILDCFYPVGYILLLYSHANPNTMYAGTTWERIQNAFLWATDSSGTIGQSGGQSEVTLTVDQLPAHSHGSVYSQHATGTKDKAWFTTSGTSMAYGPVSTGGGQAHNNMPPYIQISAWRRTT